MTIENDTPSPIVTNGASSRPPLRAVSPDERAPAPTALEELGPADYIGDTFHVYDRPEWMRDLRWTEKAVKNMPSTYSLLPTPGNIASILANDPRWKRVIQYDEFADRAVFAKPPPFHKDDDKLPRARELEDADALRLSSWFDRAYHLKVSEDASFNHLKLAAFANRRHPVREYLNRLRADGVPRIDTWLSKYLGVEDSPLNRAFARKFLIGAVARVMQPGCKVDTVLILEGDQGIRKSTGLEILAGGPQFFCELHGSLDDKDTVQMLAGKWIVEVSELSSMRRSDNESAKRFFACRVDRYRPSFGRKAQDFPRQSIFAGSTNAGGSGYLTDATGNRRYWPVACTKVDRDALIRDRDLLWAEAVQAYHMGEQWWLTVEEETLAKEAQEDRVTSDAWEDVIRAWLGLRTEVSTDEILSGCLNLDRGKWGLAEQQRVGRCMMRLKWRRRRVGSRWVYHHPGRAHLHTDPPPATPSQPALQA